jgi:HAD superfamily hydrolase (TIGR01509 family)
VRLLVFDFDGVILETEGPELASWQELWREHGEELPVERYLECIGSSGFDLCAELAARLAARAATPPTREALSARQHARWYEHLGGLRPMPGVERCLVEARALGIPVAVASSSSRDWVEGHLARVGLRAAFDAVFCKDDVPAVKPEPDLYLAALRAFGVPPRVALAFEDSANGVTAAKRAGMVCAAIPTEVTRGLRFEQADLRLSSLEDALPLSDFLKTLAPAP